MTAKPFCNGPFSILKGTSWIVGKGHHGEPCHVLDQRGWGYLTGKGQSALGLDNATASAMQAETQQWVVDAMNAAWNRSADLAAVQPAQVRVKPTDAQINSACLSYRHDFGLMTKRDQDDLRFQANEWLIAWQKEARILAAIEPQPDPRDEVIARLVEALENRLHDPECPCNACEPMLAALAAAKAVLR